MGMDPPQPQPLTELERKRLKLAEVRARARHQANQAPVANGPVVNGGDRLDENGIRDLLANVGVDPIPQLRTTPERNGLPQSAHVSPQANHQYASARALNLEFSQVHSVAHQQKDAAAYSKTTQTDDERVSVGEFSLGSQEFDYDDDMMHMDSGFRGRAHSHELDSPITEDLATLLPGFQFASKHKEETEASKALDAEPVRPREYTDEEKARILASDEFARAFLRASKILETALAEKDVAFDYTETRGGQVVASGDLLSMTRVFTDTRVANRSVTSFAYSEQFPELLLVGYDQDEHDPLKPTGVVIVWNTKTKRTTPEYIFHCQSRITSVTFATFHQHLLLAGCYSGQICMWDIRVEHKKSPITKSSLTSAAHTHPVYSLNVMGTHNAHNLVSLSSDGKMCSWDVDNLVAPIDSKNINHRGGNMMIPSLCISFPVSDTNNFVVGGENGHAYQLSRHSGADASMLEQMDYNGHSASVNALHFHRAAGVIDFSHIFLTASIDWSIMLWSTKDPQLRFTFESHMDVVVDIAWSPVHPAVFASVDSEGTLALWNLNQDTEGPISSLKIPDESGVATKLQWSENGQQLCCGDGKGSVFMFEVHDSMYVLKSEEWTLFARVLADIKQQAEDAAEDSAADSSASSAVGRLAQASGVSSVAALAGINVSPRAPM